MLAKNISLQNLCQIIKANKSFMLATHENPDGDGIGSMLALGEALRVMGKKVYWYMKDPVPKTYQYLPLQNKIKNILPARQKFGVTFIIDLGEIERVGADFVKFPNRGQTISLDHHARGAHNADLNFCLPKQASSGEVIFKIIKALKVKLNAKMAMGIYTAMVTDTGSFKYSNTTAETFGMAKELVEAGVNVWRVAQNCFETVSPAKMDLLKRVLQTMNVEANKKIASIVLKHSDFMASGANANETEGFINYPRSIEGIEVAVSYKEVEKSLYKVSLRSCNYIDVGQVAEAFGGGGHIRASGCKINGSLSEVQKKLMRVLTKAFAQAGRA